MEWDRRSGTRLSRSCCEDIAARRICWAKKGFSSSSRRSCSNGRSGAELTEHLGYEKGDPAGRGSGNSRNGFSSKTVIGDDGAIELAVPRDRNGSFEPQLVPKGQTRLEGFDDRIISLYARGLSVREIQAHLQELYGFRAAVLNFESISLQVSAGYCRASSAQAASHFPDWGLCGFRKLPARRAKHNGLNRRSWFPGAKLGPPEVRRVCK
jgi:hypothetical protein